MKQRLDRCKISVAAKLLISNKDVKKILNVTGSEVKEICEVKEERLITEEALLSSKPFKVTYKKNRVRRE